MRYKILYLPTAEVVKLPHCYTLLDMQAVMEGPEWSFVKLDNRIGLSNREPASNYAYPSIPKYLFEIVEVPDD
jgi:hypothetical protein